MFPCVFYTFSQHHHPCLHVIVMLRCGWRAFLACPECFFVCRNGLYEVMKEPLWQCEKAFSANRILDGHRTMVVRSVECQKVVLKQYFILYSEFFSQCLYNVCISVHLNVKGQKAVRVFVCVYLIIIVSRSRGLCVVALVSCSSMIYKKRMAL